MDHLLIHYTVARVLWDLVLGLVGVKWVFLNTVKEVFYSWGGYFCGKKKEKILEFDSVIHFLDGLEGKE